MINFIVKISDQDLDWLHKQARAKRISIQEYIAQLIYQDRVKNSDDPTDMDKGVSTISL